MRFPLQKTRGFTLTEMLIVIGLIVLLIALALPAFNFLTGSRSTEGATNVLSATFARARAEALGVQSPRGVILYRDPRTQRTIARLIKPVEVTTWVDARDYNVGEYVVDASVTPARYYVCITPHRSSASSPDNRPGVDTTIWRQATDPTAMNRLNPATPAPLVEITLDIIPDRESILLPNGIGASGLDNNTAAAGGMDTGNPYTGRAVIMFGGDGTLTNISYQIIADSVLATDFPSSATVPFTERSQIGLVVYDDEVAGNAGYASTWLDSNAQPLLVNRYNGTILSGK
ncbi:MAG TPA: prepilin-type N-terminal cleavage/methylation domain-containing protein [Tepidisphaeraceae bacterium]